MALDRVWMYYVLRRRLDVVEYYIEVDYCVEYFVDFSWSVYEKK